jgi:hypothetical protein
VTAFAGGFSAGSSEDGQVLVLKTSARLATGDDVAEPELHWRPGGVLLRDEEEFPHGVGKI